MEIELKFDRNKFTDMIKKMAVPISNSKRFLYPNIYPMFIPVYENGKNVTSMLEWIVQTDVTTWVRMEYDRNLWISNFENYSDLIDPIRIPIDVENILKVLKTFTDKDYIIFIHDADENIQTITDNVTRINMPVISEEPDDTVYDAYPGNLEPETEIIIFRDNTVKPDISGTFEVKSLQKLFATIKNACPKDDNRVYNFKVDGGSHLIEAYVNEEYLKVGNVVSRKFEGVSKEGHGELHYTELLENVIDILSPGTFDFHTIDCGPLWIMQETENMKVRYLIPPAAIGTY